MAGTRAGGKRAAKTNIAKHGKDFYRNIGRKGGSNGHTGGFSSEKRGKDGLTGLERARVVGAIGGRKSRRGKSTKKREGLYNNGNKVIRPTKG